MFSSEEYDARKRRLLNLMQAEGLDAVVLFASKVESGFVRYYTGYESELGIQDCSVWVLAPGSAHESALVTNAVWDEPFESSGVDETVITRDFGKTVADLLPPNTRRVGFAPYHCFPAPVYARVVARRPTPEIRDITEGLLQLRAVKSEAEIELLSKVAAIADKAGQVLVETCRPGVSEREIAAEIEHTLRLAGSGQLIFATILCAGPRTAHVIALPGERRLQSGDVVQMDCGPSLEGYRGDFSRVTWVGEADRTITSLCETSALMYEKCFQGLRPGVRSAAIAQDVIRVAEEAGYGPENFYHGKIAKPNFVGHGIGLGNPDAPQLSTEDESVIEEGMVINIETIVLAPGRGGARIEDAVVVRKTGASRLSSCPIRLWQHSRAPCA